ncbi:MAG: DUF6542 domain-containing protein [Candidatus Nanopelagicales bacterium]
MSEGFGAVRDVSDDDAYDRLFRPEPEDVLHSTYATPSLVPDVAEPAAPAGRNLVDTGRLFRSVHAQADATALTAVPAAQVHHLRTLRLEQIEPIAPILASRAFEPLPRNDYFEEAFAEPVEEVEPEEPDLIELPEPVEVRVEPIVIAETASHRSFDPIPVPAQLEQFDDLRGSYEPAAEGFWATDSMHDFDWQTGLRPTGVYTIVIGATVIAGLASALLMGSGTGLVTGLVLLIASGVTAARVRLPDAAVAVIAPPIAYFVACLTVGQIGLNGTAGLSGRVIDVFFMLASGWYWVLGPAAVALGIVIWRRRSAE